MTFHLEFSLFWRSFDLGDLSDLRRGSGIFFSKVTFLKSVHSKEKDEACLSFPVKIFTKSLHRGGVNVVQPNISMPSGDFKNSLNHIYIIIIFVLQANSRKFINREIRLQNLTQFCIIIHLRVANNVPK